MSRLPFLSAALAATAAGAALAQPGPASVSVTQLSAPDRAGAAAAPSQRAPASALDRMGRENLVSAGAPIGEGRRTAEAAPELSTRAQGRAVATSAVGGRDRCDAPAAAETELCRRRIEARSDEYGKPVTAPVTAEARLLLLTQTQPTVMTTEIATRRLGGSSQDVEALAGSAAGQLAAAISQTNPRPDTVPNGGSPTTTPTAAVVSPGATAGAVASLPAGVPSTVVIGPH